MVPKFIRTTDNIIWFAFNKIDDDYLCFPKKIGNYKGKKYSEWYENKIDELKKYRKKIDGLDEIVYMVNEKDIVKKYDSLKFVKDKEYLSLKYNLNYCVETIIKAINDFFDIPFDDIGVEGSILLDCYKDDSDIDILVFGKSNAKKIQRKFKNFQNYKDVVLFNENQISKYIEERKDCGYGNNYKLLKKQFLRRYYGFVHGKQFSIVCVPYEFENGYINLNRMIKFENNFEGVLIVTNDDNSCIVPSIYEAVDTNGKKYTIEIFNHYGINQIKKGEKVLVKGKEYRDYSNNNAIIILSFWSNVKERFDLYE